MEMPTDSFKDSIKYSRSKPSSIPKAMRSVVHSSSLMSTARLFYKLSGEKMAKIILRDYQKPRGMLNLSACVCLDPCEYKPLGSFFVFNKNKAPFSPGSCQQQGTLPFRLSFIESPQN